MSSDMLNQFLNSAQNDETIKKLEEKTKEDKINSSVTEIKKKVFQLKTLLESKTDRNFTCDHHSFFNLNNSIFCNLNLKQIAKLPGDVFFGEESHFNKRKDTSRMGWDEDELNSQNVVNSGTMLCVSEVNLFEIEYTYRGGSHTVYHFGKTVGTYNLDGMVEKISRIIYEAIKK